MNILVLNCGSSSAKELMRLCAGVTFRPKIFAVIKKEDCHKLTELSDQLSIIDPSNSPQMTAQMLEMYISEIKKIDNRLSSSISEVLLEGGVIPGNMGFQYIKEAISLYISANCAPCSLQKNIYHTIAKNNLTTLHSVDHCIRNSIEKSWYVSPEMFKLNYFGAMSRSKGWKPKPREYLLTIAERLMRDMNSDT